MSIGWEQLLCPYFSKVGLRILGDYFQQHGFHAVETGIGGLFFQKDAIFVEVSYDPQTYPDYSPTLVIGIGKEKFQKNGDPAGVPLWFVLPADSEERRYSFWKFISAQELETILDRILDQIITQYMEPLWNNPAMLKGKVESFKSTCY